MEINRYNYHFCSSMRNQGTNASPTFILTKPLHTTLPSSYFTVELSSATIPFSFKLINPTNNTVVGNIYTPVVGAPLTFQFQVPSGNYNILNLLTTLTDILTPIIAPSIIKMIYSVDVGKVSFQLSDNATLLLNFSVYDTIGEMLGVPLGITVDHILTYGIQHVNVSPARCLYFRSNSFSLDNFEYVIQRGVKSDIISRIPINSNFNSYIEFIGGRPSKVIEQNISVISIYITTDLSYEPLDLQGVHINFCLTFIEYASFPQPQPSLSEPSTQPDQSSSSYEPTNQQQVINAGIIDEISNLLGLKPPNQQAELTNEEKLNNIIKALQ